MPLAPGARLGPYEVLAAIGAGGMGEVYRARDTKLNRDVALKVLPATFASDPDRLARFHREAQVLASLNHPHIGAIYGFEDSGATHALVLEFVDGPTLADRIAQGRVPIEEALLIAVQIAEALEAAHEQGIIHRDLKPANIKLRSDGTVKVLDFGLAKLTDSGSGIGDPGSVGSLSPTITSPALMTGVGVLLGTAAYMAPEQARGKAADKRADIWAFGCVLFEMLTGTRPFGGDDTTDVIVSIVSREPEWARLPSSTPRSLRQLLARCLAKDPRQRLRDIGDARFALTEGVSADANGGATSTRRVRGSAARTAALCAVIAVTSAVVGMSLSRSRSADTPRPLMRFSIALPPDHAMDVASGGTWINFAIARDGSRLAYVGIDGQTTRLFLRSIDEVDFHPLSGTEGAENPAFSPDGTWVAFAAGNRLMKVPVVGGSPVVIAVLPSANAGGLNWNADDTILFQRGFTQGIAAVPAGGGSPTQLVSPNRERHENAVLWPQLLPGGDRLLLTVAPDSIASFDDAQVTVQSTGNERNRATIAGGMAARFLSTGHIVFGNHGALLAAVLDSSQQRLNAAPVPVVRDVMTNIAGGIVEAAFADTAGTLAYVPAIQPPRPDRLVLVDRTGREQTLRDADPFYVNESAISPDGQRIAVRVSKANDDIHVYDLATGTFSRITFDGGDEQTPLWSADGRRLAYVLQQGRVPNIYWKAVDGSDMPSAVLRSDKVQAPTSFSRDGKLLAYTENDETTGFDIWVVNLDGSPVPKPFARTMFQERRATFSPDGQWLAYESNESGEPQIYVARYPDARDKRQVSIDGGTEPIWEANGELFYRNGNRFMAVDIKTSPTVSAGRPSIMFEGAFKPAGQTGGARSFSPMPDGKHFVVARAGSAFDPPREIRIVLNWYDELRRLLPTK